MKNKVIAQEGVNSPSVFFSGTWTIMRSQVQSKIPVVPSWGSTTSANCKYFWVCNSVMQEMPSSSSPGLTKDNRGSAVCREEAEDQCEGSLAVHRPLSAACDVLFTAHLKTSKCFVLCTEGYGRLPQFLENV